MGVRCQGNREPPADSATTTTLSLNNSQCSSPTLYTHTQCILSCTTGGKQAARGREGARENRRWEGQREGRREGEVAR